MTRDTIDVIVEIPAGSRNKYELDTANHVIRLTRQLPHSLVYPGDYGFIPGTQSSDGDHLDALVLIDEPTFPGCCVSIVPLGIMWMVDEDGRDPKVIGVLPQTADHEGLADIGDLPAAATEEIEQFFSIYKEFEPGMRSETAGFEGREVARAVIIECLERFKQGHAKHGRHGHHSREGAVA